MANLRTPVRWDGRFHAPVDLLAALAPWRLWRVRRGTGRQRAGAMLVGFGRWHGLHAVLSHKRLSLYRRGALLVGGAGLPAGCAAWSAPPA